MLKIYVLSRHLLFIPFPAANQKELQSAKIQNTSSDSKTAGTQTSVQSSTLFPFCKRPSLLDFYFYVFSHILAISHSVKLTQRTLHNYYTYKC